MPNICEPAKSTLQDKEMRKAFILYTAQNYDMEIICFSANVRQCTILIALCMCNFLVQFFFLIYYSIALFPSRVSNNKIESV